MARTPLIGSQVARGIEGTGEAVIFDKGIDPNQVFLQEVADKKARDAKRAELDAETWKSLEDYRADGWYNDDVALKTMQGELKDFYADSFSKGINPDVVDPSNPESIKTYRKAQKLKDTLKAGNSSSQQMKDYFDRSSISISANPNAFTSASKADVANYWKLPLKERMGIPPPLLDKNPPTVDWYKAISGLPEIYRDVSIEKGDTTTKTRKFAREQALQHWGTFKSTTEGQSMISDKDGDEASAMQTYMDIRESKVKTQFGRALDEPRVERAAGRSRLSDLDIVTSEDTSFTPFGEAIDRSAGKRGMSVDIPGIWKKQKFKVDDQTFEGEVIRIKSDDKGDLTAVMSIPIGDGMTEEHEVKYTDQFRTSLRNSLKNNEERTEFDNFNTKLNKSISELEDLKYSSVLPARAGRAMKTATRMADEDKGRDKVQDILDQYGIEEEFEIDSYYTGDGGQLKIGGKTFDLRDSKKDRVAFQDWIVDQNPSAFLETEEEKAGSSQITEDIKKRVAKVTESVKGFFTPKPTTEKKAEAKVKEEKKLPKDKLSEADFLVREAELAKQLNLTIFELRKKYTKEQIEKTVSAPQ